MHNEDNLNFTLNYLINKNISYKEALSIIKSYPKILENPNLLDSIFLIFNAKKLYGFISFMDSSYELYTLLETQSQQPVFLKRKSIEDDYVIQSLISALDKDYVKKALELQGDESFQERLVKLKNANLNSKGYKVR